MKVSFEKKWIVTVRNNFGDVTDRFEKTGYTREQVKAQLDNYGYCYKVTIAPNNEANKRIHANNVMEEEHKKRRYIKYKAMNMFMKKYGIAIDDLRNLEKSGTTMIAELISFCEKRSS